MATMTEAKQALTDALAAAAEGQTHPASLLMLAEAWAWLNSSGQPHGGNNFVK